MNEKAEQGRLVPPPPKPREDPHPFIHLGAQPEYVPTNNDIGF